MKCMCMVCMLVLVLALVLVLVPCTGSSGALNLGIQLLLQLPIAAR